MATPMVTEASVGIYFNQNNFFPPLSSDSWVKAFTLVSISDKITRNNILNISILKKQYDWDLSPFYKSENDPQIEKDIEKESKLAEAFIKKWKNRKDYLEDPNVLCTALSEYEKFTDGGIFNKPLYYLWLRTHLDQTDKKVKAKEKLVYDKAIQYINRLQFFDLKIGKIKRRLQKKFLTSPALSKYKHNLERSFTLSKYDLTEKEETVINLLSPNSSSNWSDMLNEFLSKETGTVNNKRITFEELFSLTEKPEQAVRDKAGKEIDRILGKWVDIAEHEINTAIDTQRKIRELRKISEPDKLRHISDDIETKVVKRLIKSVTNSFYISHRYYSLISKLLRKKSLGYHERGVTYGKIKSKHKIKDALSLVSKTYMKLDKGLGNIVTEMISKRRIDAFPKKGKCSGAFCVFSGSKFPVYVLLNHTNTLPDTLTIAHELGHAVNDHLQIRNLPQNNLGTPLSTAEVASTFFENFLLEEILKKASPEEKLSILINRLSSDISTIFRQTACYNFELELHDEIKKKGYLTKEKIGELFNKHMSAYLGPNVKLTKKHENWWVYWSHIRSPFYVYSYASGLLISKFLQVKVKEDSKFMIKVKQFLSAGISKSPKEIFLDLGIDITENSFWEKGLKDIENLLNTTEELAKNLGRI